MSGSAWPTAPTGTFDEWMADTYFKNLRVATCLHCGWWAQARKPTPGAPNPGACAPSRCPQCDLHHGKPGRIVLGVATITLDPQEDQP